MSGRTAVVLGYVIDDAREELAELMGLTIDPWSLTDGQVVELMEDYHPGGWATFLRESAV
ncbi:hypothetical protein [Micromonospora sp. GCM10011541]|uniref:hypothetical protein n=1 Tax=Micromonospora sp. GCM10011541 TaxID=3317336 RepID=UPI003618BDC1